MQKRKLDVVVISDVHLGTYGCQAEELNSYLKSIDPSILVLNGDIIDAWQFRKYYFPESHLKVVRRIMKMMMQGTKVYYLTGNHDEILRRFSDIEAGNFFLLDKLLLNLNGKKTWIFHGDVFDVTMRYSKFVAKMGGFGYDFLILLNSVINKISVWLGRGKISLSKRIKDSVKSAIRFVSDFEMTAIDLAFQHQYDYVICGHIHRPNILSHERRDHKVTYMNSGDWIENLTALEYRSEQWDLFRYEESNLNISNIDGTDTDELADNISLENLLIRTFHFTDK
jgi:UDP-2,3-diacylglucosamine pyrophosphatase LpxH